MSTSNAQVYRVAIIGTGRMGGLIEDELSVNQFSSPYGHFSAYQFIEQTEVVAIANRGAERLQRFSDRFGLTNTYLDYKEMIQVEKPDIVSVTTPSFARPEPIIFAAEIGVKGIYAEKGLAPSLESADRVLAACQSHQVAFNWGAMRGDITTDLFASKRPFRMVRSSTPLRRHVHQDQSNQTSPTHLRSGFDAAWRPETRVGRGSTRSCTRD